MPTPTIPVLGAATLNRKWIYEFNLATVASPSWGVLGGLMNSQLNPDTPNWVSDTDQAGQGFESSTKTGATWGSALKIVRKVASAATPTLYDTVQEFLRLKSIGKFGTSNTVQTRISEYDPNDPTGVATPRVEAYTGFCGVSWPPDGGDMLAEDLVSVALVGQGALLAITHPYPAAATVPVIYSASPLAISTAGGQLVNIVGVGLAGAVATSGVKFASTNATSWFVVNDSEIVALTPAHAAGSGPIVVTNATGPSTTGPTVTYS